MNKSYGITSKYQVTIPKPVREQLAIAASDHIRFSVEGGRAYLEKAPSLGAVQTHLQTGLRRRGTKPATDEQIKHARDAFHRRGLRW